MLPTAVSSSLQELLCGRDTCNKDTPKVLLDGSIGATPTRQVHVLLHSAYDATCGIMDPDLGDREVKRINQKKPNASQSSPVSIPRCERRNFRAAECPGTSLAADCAVFSPPVAMLKAPPCGSRPAPCSAWSAGCLPHPSTAESRFLESCNLDS